MSQFVNYDAFDGNRAFAVSPETKQYDQPNGQKGSYATMTLQYNYGTVDKPSTEGIYFQTCKVWCNGIKEQPNQKDPSKVDTSCMITFDLKRDDDVKCVNVIMGSLYARIAQCVAQHKGTMKIPYFNPAMPAATGLKELLYFHRDPLTQELIPGKNPTTFLKLNVGFNRTCFVKPNGDPISWEILKCAKFLCTPLIHYATVYAGGNGKAIPQYKLASAVVWEIIPSDENSRQNTTCKQAMETNPESLDKLEQQMAALMKKMEDLKTTPKLSTKVATPGVSAGAGVGAGAGFSSGTGAGAGMGTGFNSGTGAGMGIGFNSGTGAGVNGLLGSAPSSSSSFSSPSTPSFIPLSTSTSSFSNSSTPSSTPLTSPGNMLAPMPTFNKIPEPIPSPSSFNTFTSQNVQPQAQQQQPIQQQAVMFPMNPQPSSQPVQQQQPIQQVQQPIQQQQQPMQQVQPIQQQQQQFQPVQQFQSVQPIQSAPQQMQPVQPIILQ